MKLHHWSLWANDNCHPLFYFKTRLVMAYICVAFHLHEQFFDAFSKHLCFQNFFGKFHICMAFHFHGQFFDALSKHFFVQNFFGKFQICLSKFHICVAFHFHGQFFDAFSLYILLQISLGIFCIWNASYFLETFFDSLLWNSFTCLLRAQFHLVEKLQTMHWKDFKFFRFALLRCFSLKSTFCQNIFPCLYSEF